MARFEVDGELVEKAKNVLSDRSEIVWILGGSCSGKTRLCSHVAESLSRTVYDMDKYIFGDYFERYDSIRHPATVEWFYQENGLDWVLSLDWEEFHSLNAAVAAEYLDLFSDDVSSGASDNGLIVDGGLARPSVLCEALVPGQIIYLHRDEFRRAAEWETNPERAEMKRMVIDLGNGDKTWKKFLEFDRLMTAKMLEESVACGVKIVDVAENMAVADLAGVVFGNR